MYQTLYERLRDAFHSVDPGADPVLRPSTRPGVDFQANGAMALAKRRGANPGQLAGEVAEAARLADICSLVEVSPQGFINLTLDDSFIAQAVQTQAADPRLGVDPAENPRTVIVDYSSPNVAKEMHAGHLRTTIIGDALCRMLTFVGEKVIRENH
ncbi:MAG TPA: arginine--tRNA ligase, partial [Acidimicrobiales bacterium]|nr:arginine--tRNA ligase [Acidimicrobiales bacterium]